jgi:hypothetical protein
MTQRMSGSAALPADRFGTGLLHEILGRQPGLGLLQYLMQQPGDLAPHGHFHRKYL